MGYPLIQYSSEYVEIFSKYLKQTSFMVSPIFLPSKFIFMNSKFVNGTDKNRKYENSSHLVALLQTCRSQRATGRRVGTLRSCTLGTFQPEQMPTSTHNFPRLIDCADKLTNKAHW